MMLFDGRAFLAPVFMVFLSLVVNSKAADSVKLAENSSACMPVVIAEQASPRVQAAAHVLADYLGKISGAQFDVITNAGASGLVVGTASDFPQGFPDKNWMDSRDPAEKERYILRSHPAGVWLVGVTDLAVEHAVWDFLYRLGYRQFFPTPTWEIIPRIAEMAVVVDADEKPDYWSRIVGYSFWDYNRTTWDAWTARNRMASLFDVSCGHHYQAILSNERKVFDEHPEYLGLVNGKRVSDKFCIANPGFRALAVAHAMRYFDKNPGNESISMEPSDGGGWCECDECAKLGGISDRAAALACEVARAVMPRGKWVGMLAYNQHASPPTITMESNIVVRVTTHQARGSLTLEERVRGWSKTGAAIGISEAYCTCVWDWFLPARQNGSDLVYIVSTIPRFHKWGVRIMGGWTADSWGPVGLGNYLIARLLWDIGEADRLDELVDDFLDRCFGAARPPMEKFYRLICRFNKNDARPMLSEHMLGQMYGFLEQAGALAADPAVRRRVDDLILYTRYVDLFFQYQNSKNEEDKPDTAALDSAIFGGDAEPAQTKGQRQKAFETLIRYAYRIRKTEMIETKALYGQLYGFDDRVFIPKEAGLGVPEEKNPWKSSKPFSDSEILAIVKEGKTRNKMLDFEPVAFGDNLVPADVLKLRSAPTGSQGSASRQHSQRFYTWVDKTPGIVKLSATCGLYEKDRGPVKITLYSPLSMGADGQPAPVSATNAPPDAKPHEVELSTPYAGMHWIEARTVGDRAAIDLRGPCVIKSSLDFPEHTPVGGWSLYFYVPKGTKNVGGFAEESTGRMLDGDGRNVFSFESLGKPAYFSVPVPPGQDGCVWKFDAVSGRRLLMTTPPYLAKKPEDLLLPEEVVERDRK